MIKSILRRVRRKSHFELRARKVEKGSTIIEMKAVTKRFPGVIANDHVDFEVKAGEIHALLGENGAGKTTLMNILYGLYTLDEGEIYIRGQKVVIRSPQDAIKLGIGMVHQHFTLVPSFSVVENVILGLKSAKEPFLDIDRAKEKIISLSETFGLKVDPEVEVWRLSVGEQQRVEILKALYRDVEILILDEPTSVLTPHEVKMLFKTLRTMTEKGLTIIFITHKLPEVMAISDRVTVLKNGRVVATLETSKTNERELSKLMVGREVLFRLSKGYNAKKGEVVLDVKNVQVLDDRGLLAVKGVSFQVRKGEILGIAGVAGNGQRELVEAITGLRKIASGKVFIKGRDVTNRPPIEIIKLGTAYIPENRMERGIIADFSVMENIILKCHSDSPFANKWLLNFSKIYAYADKLISEYDVKTPNRNIPAKSLSGGNIQRLILARELSRNPELLIANKPTRGLDVGSTEFIHHKLLEERAKGTAILLISEDLDEILSLSDRIAVMYEGKIIGIVPADKADINEIGLMMAGVSGQHMSMHTC